MAVFRCIANQVFNKSAIETKLSGTIEDFKKIINWGSSDDQEDDHILVLGSMNFDAFYNSDYYKQLGIDSTDIALIGRYGNIKEQDWLVDAGEFFWHVEEDKEIGHYNKWINEYSADEILERFGGLLYMRDAINNRTFKQATNPVRR